MIKKQTSENRKRRIISLNEAEDTDSPACIGQNLNLEKFIKSLKNIRENALDRDDGNSKTSKNVGIKGKLSDKEIKETQNHSKANVSVVKNDNKNSKDKSKSIENCSNRRTFIDGQLRQLYEKGMGKSIKKIDSVKSGNLSIKAVQKVMNKRLQKTSEVFEKDRKEIHKKSMKKSDIKIRKIPSIQLDFLIGSKLFAEKRENVIRNQKKEVFKKEESESKRFKHLKTEMFENSTRKKQKMNEFPTSNEALKQRINETCNDAQKEIKADIIQSFPASQIYEIDSKKKHVLKISQDNIRLRNHETPVKNQNKNNKNGGKNSSKKKIFIENLNLKNQNKINLKKSGNEINEMKMEKSKSHENLVNSICVNMISINKNSIRNSKFIENGSRKPSNKLKIRCSNDFRPNLKKLKTDSSRSRSKHLFRKLDTIIGNFQKSDKKSIRSFIQNKQNQQEKKEDKKSNNDQNESVVFQHQNITEESFRTREFVTNIEEFFRT